MYEKARPIWLDGLQAQVNLQAVFRARFRCASPAAGAVLRVTGAALYRARLNGEFAGYGPARAAGGYTRVDELPVGPLLVPGENLLEIEVAGYNCNSFYTVNQLSFLCAELVVDGAPLVYTGRDFAGWRVAARHQVVLRYSYQRHFTEVWSLPRADQPLPVQELRLPLETLPRGVPLPEYPLYEAQWRGRGRAREDPAAPVKRPRYIANVSPSLTGFPEADTPRSAYYIWQRLRYTPDDAADGALPAVIKAGEYVLTDLGQNRTGFIRARLRAQRKSRVFIVFDEKLAGGMIDPRQIDMVNLVEYCLAPEDEPYALESFEVYGFRYAAVIVAEGEAELLALGVRGYVAPVRPPALPAGASPALCAIYTAAVETYRQNAVDLFMDCPTRERAGWLCDSYFTAPAEVLFTGENRVEAAFLENYRLFGGHTNLPRGMLPMCYPADHPRGRFIPQWAMWYVVELDNYLRRHPGEGAGPWRRLCYDLLAFFANYRNADGLLECLPSWNFVEWSEANDWTWDVNYPTNMLYARVLEVVGALFDDAALAAQAAQVRQVVVAQSFNGMFFTDHALRNSHQGLVNPGRISEACQYYAFAFGTARREDPRFSGLWRRLMEEFGPQRDVKTTHPVVVKANALMGTYLRLELLLEAGEYRRALEEVEACFSGMAELTGTLWENQFLAGSLNHGFASYAGVVIHRALAELARDILHQE